MCKFVFRKDTRWGINLAKINFRNITKLNIILALLLLFLFVIIYKCINNKGEILFDKYMSYSSVLEIQTELTKKGLSLKLVDTEEYPSRGKNCPSNVAKYYEAYIDDDNFVFKFFNNQLYSITIYPLDEIKTKKYENKISFTLCTSWYRAMDYKNKVYLRVYDRRIDYKLKKWIVNCS